MEKMINTFEARSCPEVWMNAVEFLLSCDSRASFNVVLGITTPHELTPADFQVHDMVDLFLRQHDSAPLNSIASTIFPAGYYLQSGVRGVYEEYLDNYPTLRGSHWGTYAYRILRRSQATRTGNLDDHFNPLEKIVEKIAEQRKGGHFRAVYEMNTIETEDFFELPTYDGALDRNRTRQHPCLSHLSFKLTREDKVMLTAVYRYHYYVQKALGNLLGLAQLLLFVARETGAEVGPLICHSTYAIADTGGWTADDVQGLLDDAKSIYANTEEVEVPHA